MKKYKLLENGKIKFDGIDLYRIKALRDIINKKGKIVVKEGELGGYIESENNLSHKGSCWIYDNSKVYGDVEIKGNSKIKNNSCIEGSDALVIENSKISNCDIYGEETILNSVLKNLKIEGDGYIIDFDFELNKNYKDSYYLDTEYFDTVKLINGFDSIEAVYLLKKDSENYSFEGDIFIDNEPGEILTEKLKIKMLSRIANYHKDEKEILKMQFNYIENLYKIQKEEALR